MHTSLLAASVLSLLSAANAAVIEHWWNISYATANPDTQFSRRVIGINGTWPPPIVTATQGDQVIIHATNGMPDVGTGLHSHGIFFNGSGYFDGANFVTQCPIPPGATLDYEIPTDLQSGTYWIHGHYLGQYVDGLRTPFIINPATPPEQYDDEYMIVLGDWYHEQHSDLLNYYLNIYNPTGAEPIPDTAIAFVAHNQSYVNSLSDIANGVGVSSANSTGAALNFEPGKKYKIRVVNTAAFAMFRFSIGGHTMQVVELDGTEVVPYTVSSVPITAAQRVSFIVEALNDTTQNYPIMMNMDGEMFDTIPEGLVLNITGQIVYDSSNPVAEPIIYQSYDTWWDTVFVPTESQASAPADLSLDLNIWFETYTDGTNRGSFNNITYQMPPVPSIFTQLTMGSEAYNPAIYGAQTNAYILNYMDNIELNVYNWHTDNHPFHLHGHKFQVMRLSQDVMSNDTSLNPDLVEDQSNPLRRDTIMIPAGGMVTLRFRADNPGTWIFHCHIEWHLESGLAVVFMEAPTQAQERLQVPQAMLDQCAAQGIAASGNVVGLDSDTDFNGEPLGPYPQQTIMGWTPKAMGAMAGTIISAVIGMLIVVWYAMDPFKDEEREELAREEFEKKQNSAKMSIVKKIIPGKKTNNASTQSVGG